MTHHQQLKEKGQKEAGATRPCALPESSLLESILAEQCTHRQERPWARMIVQR